MYISCNAGAPPSIASACRRVCLPGALPACQATLLAQRRCRGRQSMQKKGLKWSVRSQDASSARQKTSWPSKAKERQLAQIGRNVAVPTFIMPGQAPATPRECSTSRFAPDSHPPHCRTARVSAEVSADRETGLVLPSRTLPWTFATLQREVAAGADGVAPDVDANRGVWFMRPSYSGPGESAHGIGWPVSAEPGWPSLRSRARLRQPVLPAGLGPSAPHSGGCR